MSKLLKRLGTKKVVVICTLLLLSILLYAKNIHHGFDTDVLVRMQGYYNSRLLISRFQQSDEPLVIFPRDFHLYNPKQLLQYYKDNFHFDNNREFNVLRYNGEEESLANPHLLKGFHEYGINLYNAVRGDKVANSDGEAMQVLAPQISEPQEFESDYNAITKQLLKQLTNEPAFKSLRDFLGKEVERMISEGSPDNHWDRFAGSSVWLLDYGVHLMISRLVYTPTGIKNQPALSLIYAQVFNEQWEELKDVELVVSTLDPTTKETGYRAVRYPSFLPIPFYFGPKYTSKRYYGPEDARVTLFQNEQGKDEPVIIFNAYHRKIGNLKSLEESTSEIKFEYFRSMFMGWPFRFQIGKHNVDGISDTRLDDIEFNKVVEMRREGAKRLPVQKNWTPFISMKDRARDGYDQYIYFVYRWLKLEILKCQLATFTKDISLCHFDYKRDEKLSPTEDVGPLRGGTEMISLDSILPSFRRYVNPLKEVWIGFARAHIKYCGCGRDMYRPNLALITKEGNKFKVSQLSSFMSLDVDVVGWSNPDVLCHPREANVLIPNGISEWRMRNIKIGKRKVLEDIVTLSYSVADSTVNQIQFKNLLHFVLSDTNILSYNTTAGYTDEVIHNALEESKKFCKAYGQEQEKLGKVPLPKGQ